MKPFLASGAMPSRVISGGNKSPLLAMASSIAMSHHEGGMEPAILTDWQATRFL